MSDTEVTREPRWLAPLCFLLPAGLYLSTAARTVQGGDTGEFGLIGMFGGVPHPPGYPLYALLARAVGYLPIQPPFFRIALASVLCGAGAVVVVEKIAWRLTERAWIAAAVALTFAVSPLQWRLAGVPEVFTLHALLAALVVLYSLRLASAPAEAVADEAVVLGLIFGLGCSNHQTIIFCAPVCVAALAAVWLRVGAAATLKAFGVAFVTGLIGLTPYLLLMSWASLDPTRSSVWGATGTWDGLVRHVLRKDYGTFQLGATDRGPGHWMYVGDMAKSLLRQYIFVLALTGLAGVVFGLRRRRLIAAGLLVSFLLAAIFFPFLIRFTHTSLHLEVAQRFFLLPTLLFAPFVAWGLLAAEPYVKRELLAAVIGAALLLSAAASFRSVSWRGDTTIERYIAAAFESLPPHAVVIGLSDTMLPAVNWMQHVRGLRPDVVYIDVNGLGMRWHYDAVKKAFPEYPHPFEAVRWQAGELAGALAQLRPTFLLPGLVHEAKESAVVVPQGFLYRVATHPMPDDLDRQRAALERDMKLLGGELPEPADAWSADIRGAMVAPWADLIEAYQAAGRTKDVEEAERRTAELLPPPELDDDAEEDAAGTIAGESHR